MNIKISNIKIGNRFRKDFGNLTPLVESIRRHGKLLHPIVITDKEELICGRRRIEAYKILGLEEIEANIINLDNSSLIEAEADENNARKDFTVSEMAEIDEMLREKEELAAKERQKGGIPVRNLSKGRSTAKIAERFGISPSQLDKIRYVRESAIRNPATYEETWNMVGRGKIKPDKGFNYIKRLEKIEAAKNVALENITSKNSLYDLKLGPMQKKCKEIQANSVQLIFTDPPYNEESVPLYGEVAKEAQILLNPGGSLIVIIGTYALFKINKLIEENSELKFHWMFCIKHSGGSGKMWKERVWPKWKPALWYYKPGGSDSNGRTGNSPTMYTDIEDFIDSKPVDKIMDDWEQSIIEADHIIRPLTVEGQLVLDPLMGTGTFGEAAIKLRRRFIGIEKNKETYSMAAQRLAEINLYDDNTCNDILDKSSVSDSSSDIQAAGGGMRNE